jgi:hypothetical protein
VGSGTARYRERESLLHGKISALVAEVNALKRRAFNGNRPHFADLFTSCARIFFKAREPILL